MRPFVTRRLAGLAAALTSAALSVSCASAPPEVPGPSVSSAPSASTAATETASPTAPPPRAGTAPKAPIALSEYFKVRRISLLAFSSDEKTIAYLSDEGGRPDVWVRPLAGGQATQITHAEGFVHSLAFSPKTDALAFEADRGGDELPHLYLTSSKGETPREVVPDLPAGRRTQLVQWSEDGKTLLFLSNAREEKYMDLYEHDVAKKKSSPRTTITSASSSSRIDSSTTMCSVTRA